jgi:hypothetical protein
MSRLMATIWLTLFGLLLPVVAADPAESPVPANRVAIVVDSLEGTVGDRIAVELRVTLDGKTRFEPPELGPTLGKLSVVDGLWSQPDQSDGSVWIWHGKVVAFRPGEQTLPSVKLTVTDDDGKATSLSTEEVTLQIVSVLAEQDEEEIADLKPPAQVAADYRTLWVGSAVLLAALLVVALLWWLQRRYASKLAAAEVDKDRFIRIPPHEWVYAELQKLLDRRLAEQGEMEEFFAELARIMKIYLGGRFRRDLLERTSAEVPSDLSQAGAEENAIEQVSLLLDRCDAVKFAALSPAAEACREATEQAYSIVDLTRPQRVKSATDAQAGGS